MEEPGKVELYITYQVYCAAWKPCYDIRASSAEEEEDNGASVQLCYYGLVEQNTGDDWKDCDIVLSTCSASLGGSPPPLSTLSATLNTSRSTRRHHASSAARRKAPLSVPSEEDMGFGSFDYNEIVDAAALHRWHNGGVRSRSSEENSVSTQALESTVSTCFSIPRAVTILSNAVEHKLLISKVRLVYNLGNGKAGKCRPLLYFGFTGACTFGSTTANKSFESISFVKHQKNILKCF